MTGAILLDTCAVIWMATAQDLKPDARAALDDAWANGVDVAVSPMSAWEIGLLSARGRLPLGQSPARWWRQFMATSHVVLLELAPEVLIASSHLPGAPPADPADRILAATARELGLRLMTRDRLLLQYGEAGHLNTIAC